MGVPTIAHVHGPGKSPLQVETTVRALRSSLWVSLFLSQELQLRDVQDVLTRILRDVDRLLEDLAVAL
jgi:hypothetical protein